MNIERFGTDWPANCPPAGAQPPSGKVFRVVMTDPPTANDFLTAYEAGKFRKACPCRRRGVSVLGEIADAIHQREVFPWQGEYIAEAQLDPSHGMILSTKGTSPSHATWWPYASVNRAALFSVVRGEA